MTHEEFEALTAEEIRKLMESLTQFPGWKVLTKILNRDEIEPLREKLLTGEFKSVEEIKAVQERLQLIENVVYCPEAQVMLLEPEEEILEEEKLKEENDRD